MTQLELHFQADATPLRDAHTALENAAAMLQILDAWLDAGWLQQLDVAFARFLLTEQPQASPLLLLAAALASHQLGRGHVCLELAATLSGADKVLSLPPDTDEAGDDGLITPSRLLRGLTLSRWMEALDPAIVGDGTRVTPLVHDNGRLYLYRYWSYERAVASAIAGRVAVSARSGGEELPADRVRPLLDTLFPGAAQNAGPDWQKIACALAARTRFAVVTGGPGTGKTTTVIRLLALLQALHYERHRSGGGGESWRPLRIQLAAPTGKAAARLGESIAGKLSTIPADALPGGAQVVAAIPSRVVTLHRLLGGRPHTQTRKYDAENPLPVDVLVIDEASMVSLSEMAHVVAAMPPAAQLILIGDKDQLASVEAGAVLGELCRRAQGGHYLPAIADWVAAATGMQLPAAVVDPAGRALDQAVSMLRVSYRFGEHTGIGRLAAAVNEGRTDDAIELLESRSDTLNYVCVGGPEDTRIAQIVVDGGPAAKEPHGYRHYLELVARRPQTNDAADFDAWAGGVLEAQRACQVLCVLREGPWGVQGLNRLIAHILHRRGLIPEPSGWYAGRPVMITRNNPALRLTNGDIGVVLPYPAGAGQFALRVAFPAAEGGGVRWFAPNRLEDVETVYALTVHKSQGSEFDHAVLVLPPTASPVLTRELVYTGVTRASKWLTLVNPAGSDLLRQVIGQRVYRSGGLGDVLASME